MTPDGVAVYVSRTHQSGVQGQASSYERMADGIANAAMLLATSDVDVIAFGCTSCTYFVSPERVRNDMRETAGCPAILTADAVLDAMRAMQFTCIAVIGPRTELVTQREVEFLTASGIEITAARCLGLGETEEERRSIGRVPPQVVHRLALSADSAQAQAIFISCTQLPTLSMIEPLERVLGKPVITSNQATMWRCLRAIKFGDSIPGFGKLLAENPVLVD
jgi:arylmalonate decarboxylase